MKYSTLLFSIVIFTLVSCFSDRDDNLDIGQDPEEGEPVDVTELIAEDSELFSLMETITFQYPFETETVCIEFVYSFTAIEYDEEGIEVARQIISSDTIFYRFLQNIPEDHYINLSFPISTVLPDGTTFEVSTKEELKAALDECSIAFQEEIVSICEGIVENCAWLVTLPEDSDPNPFENSVFTETVAGLNSYFYRGTEYNSSWIFLFIGDKLFLNIAIEDEDEVGMQWNYNWEVTIPDEETLVIVDDEGQEYLLTEVCDPELLCTELSVTECELAGQPDVAEFNLEDYIDCIDIIAAPFIEDPEAQVDFIFTFHLSQADADANVNAINTGTPYLNTSNPQILYVRIEHPDTGEYVIAELELVVEACT